MATMGRLEFGRLSAAWKGEASDFTPLLGERLDQLGAAIGVDLDQIGQTEVASDGGRWIDIVASGADGSELVVENQYGRADHDHLTRGLAYAVARRARGLIVVAEEHRDEFRAVAHYLNEVAESAPDRGIAVWLVEAKAVRVDGGPWAPLFTPVIAPNSFTTAVEQTKQASRLRTIDEFVERLDSAEAAQATREIVDGWLKRGHRFYLGSNKVVLEARGPSAKGGPSIRAVATIYVDGSIMIPVDAYRGTNSARIEALTTPGFETRIGQLFSIDVQERRFRTEPAWLETERVVSVLDFCSTVADEYALALAAATTGPIQ